VNQVKTGELIRYFRTEQNLTQKQLADLINVSDKAVSKWECGNGCPDISILYELSRVLNTEIDVLLSGEIKKNESEKYDMKKLNLYVCKECGNVITAASAASVTCCGSKLSALEPKKAEKNEMLILEDMGDEWFVRSDHEMTKEHYISFVIFMNINNVMFFKQYPEWNMQIRIPKYRSGRIIWYCSKCGILYQDIAKK